jgi:hypothetical protein
MCAINRLVVEGAESLALRALVAALRVRRNLGGVPDGTDEIFTIRLPARPVNAEVKKSFRGHHANATFELRGGAVKAVARRVERSESLTPRVGPCSPSCSLSKR